MGEREDMTGVARITGLLAAVMLAAVVQLPADADSKYKPCSLLTSAEVEAVLGTKVAGAQEHDITVTEGPYKGEIMSGCTWDTGSRVGASLSVIRGPRTQEERDAGSANLRKLLDGLKQKGWRIESATIPGALCSRAVPPAGDADAPTFASCFMESKGLAFGLYAFSPSVTPQQVKALGDKIAARLP
jgi:hypothetical protein